jgi:[ribosomal protein S5]-alanine N-acetyltransferase
MLCLNLPARIDTDRLVLQRLRYEDAEEIFYVYASKEEATRYVSWPTHQSVQETRRFLDYAVKAWDGGADYTFSIRLRDSNLLIGSFGVINDYGKVSFGYILGPNHWSHGYATEACNAIMKNLKELREVYRIWTLVDVDNTASCNVLEKCGFVKEARLHKWFRFINQDNQPKDCFIYRLP